MTWDEAEDDDWRKEVKCLIQLDVDVKMTDMRMWMKKDDLGGGGGGGKGMMTISARVS